MFSGLFYATMRAVDPSGTVQQGSITSRASARDIEAFAEGVEQSRKLVQSETDDVVETSSEAVIRLATRIAAEKNKQDGSETAH